MLGVCLFFCPLVCSIERIPLHRVSGDIQNKKPIDKCKFIGPVYCSDVFLGTPAQKIKAVWDTAQAKMWVLSSECKSGLCLDNKERYNGNDSESFVPGENSIILKEGDNLIKGIVSKDILLVGSLDASEKNYVEVTKAFGPELQEWRFDGVIGLEKRGTQSNKIPLLGDSIAEEFTQRNVFGVWLKKGTETGYGGEISFGGFDSTRFTDEVKFIPLRKHGRWEMTLHSVLVNGSSVISRPRIAAISMASFLLGIPEEDCFLIHSILGFQKEGDFYKIDCDKIGSLKNIAFVLGGHQFNLAPAEYTFVENKKCFSGLASVKETTAVEKTWCLGSLFFQTYYGIFDLNTGRVGLVRSIQ